MQRAVPVASAQWRRCWGLILRRLSKLRKKPDRGRNLRAANDNAVGQVVVSGHAAAVARAIDWPRNVVPNAPWNCPSARRFTVSMQPAADEMQAALAETKIASPVVPVIANARGTGQ